MEQLLEETHAALGPVGAAISLALASRRGVTKRRIALWTRELREIADRLERSITDATR